MAQAAIGMIETRGLTVLVQATDAALKAADVVYTGWKKVGSGLCSVYFAGEVAAVTAAVRAGEAAGKAVGEVVSVHVIPRPHAEVKAILPRPALG